MGLITDLFSTIAILEPVAFLGFLVFLVYLSGRLSGTETALTSLSAVDLEELISGKKKNALIIQQLRQDLDRTIITILIGNNFINITASALASVFAFTVFGNIGVSVGVGALTFLILLFGEITPKAYALKNRKKISQKNARAILIASKVLSPMVTLLHRMSAAVIEVGGGADDEDTPSLFSEANIKGIVRLSEKQGLIDPIERELIHNVFQFGDRIVDEVMIPMDKVITLDSRFTVTRAKAFIRYHKFTRFPVKDHSTGKIIGVLHSKDLLGVRFGKVPGFARRPSHIHRREKIAILFHMMKVSHTHMAIVNDGKKNAVGVVTMEDLLEEIVGEIYDEHDEEVEVTQEIPEEQVRVKIEN